MTELSAKNHYNFHRYDSKARWLSYWHQIKEVLALQPKNVLEIGVGNKTVANYLKEQGIILTTLDTNKELQPDIVGNVLNLPLNDNSFEVILCAEVLEHLPFEEFARALKELRRVAKRYVVLSLPHFGPPVKLLFKLPFLREKKIAFKIPFPKRHELGKEHCWEIGKKGYSLAKIKKIIKEYFKLKNDFIPFANQYHHFFILEKEDRT